MPLRRQLNLACVSVLSCLTACGVVPRVNVIGSVGTVGKTDTPTSVVGVRPPARSTPAVPTRLRGLSTKERAAFHRWVLHVELAAFYAALWQATYGIPPDLAPVVACIYNHESGDYTESANPGGASGAAQWEPPTWQTWFGRWAIAYAYAAGPYAYGYAYEAPSYVQDAVLVFTLTHGGAHNWNPAFGDDPCTVGMG